MISIIIPTYNYAQLLPRALDSVLVQQAKDVELIVVDDGSGDHTGDVLAAYAARHPRMQVIRQANSGAAAARNRGIREARGAYALLLDADDELMPNALANLRAVLARNPCVGAILGAHVAVHPNGRERLLTPEAIPSAPALQLARRYLLDKRVSISHGCSLFRRDLLLRRPYPENLRGGEDVAVFTYVLVSAPVAVTREPLARIHKHADSLRHNRENAEQRALLMVSEVFASLPAECQVLRQDYQAQRYLSLFRAALLADDPTAALRFYRCAWQLSPLQALRWRYLNKAIRSLTSPRGWH